MPLTQKTIDSLKPTSTRQQRADGRGLYFVLQPSGSASWALWYRVGGRQRKLTLGSYPALSLKSARDRANEALVSIAKGGDPALEKIDARRAARHPADHDIIEKVVEFFIRNYARRKLKATTLRDVERILDKEIVKAWSNRKLSEIRPPDVHKLLDKIVERPAPITANRVHAWLKLMCSWAVERQIVETSPCALIKPPSEERSRERILSDDELRDVWNAAEALGGPYGQIVQLLILTGQRRAEVTELCWDEVDLADKTWTLPGERAKNAREHSISLSPPAIQIVNSAVRIDDSRFVFTFSGTKPLSGYALIKSRLDDLLPKDMAPWTLHDLRRTFASGLAKLGVAVHVTEKILNHTGGTMSGIVGVYQRHSYADEQRAAVEAWARYVEQLASGKPAANVVPIKAVGG